MNLYSFFRECNLYSKTYKPTKGSLSSSHLFVTPLHKWRQIHDDNKAILAVRIKTFCSFTNLDKIKSLERSKSGNLVKISSYKGFGTLQIF